MPIALWADVIPEAPAIVSASGVLTFAELNARCNQLARALRARGVRAGDGVALLCSNRPEFSEVFWCTRRSGLRLTTINWHLTAGEASYIVGDCDAKVLFVEQRFEELARKLAAANPQLRCKIAIGGPIEGYEEYASLLADQSPANIEDPQLGTHMLYTSGTTGRPKGVFRPPVPVAASPMTVAADYRPGASVHLLTGPLYHAAPLSFSLAIPQAYGAAIVVMDHWDAEQALALIEQHRVTHSHMVPTMFHRLLSLPEAERKRYDVSSLQFLLHGAAPCPLQLKSALLDWLGPIVHEYYAATEGTGTYVDSLTWLQKPGTVGRSVPEDHVKILDEHGRELDVGEIGQVYLKSPEQGRFNYYKDQGKTERAYRGAYYTLGDLGYLDADGYLFLTDRSAHLIISGGVNIYPAEIEAVLLTHPAIADVGVIGVPNAEWGEEVKAVATLQRGWERSPQLMGELIEYCRGHLAHYKCPRSVDFVDELPRHDNGKLYKHKLRDSYRPKPAESS
ncbi:MAG TPA: AMP-binding protein [Polyangiales bacterium]|nr:AMP-binding protein [Polyangiales bacterium]